MTTTRVEPKVMRVAQISKPGGDFELVDREIPKPDRGQVRIKVQACGICHSDVMVKDGLWPGIQYPRIPGHEVVGTVDELGVGVSAWKIGQRVGIGWHGGQDGTCRYCRRGDFRNCRNVTIPGSRALTTRPLFEFRQSSMAKPAGAGHAGTGDTSSEVFPSATRQVSENASIS